ncbi:MAG TPA: alanine dehydrogenase [Burkholderiales bacterium]|nr:alanine dehydrogenase [Burkholderiales bacterium]
MLIGVPRESKVQEHRVGLVPESVRELVAQGHQVLVERAAGSGIGVADDEYRAAGASVAADADAVWGRAELIVKVKEPQAGERKWLRAGQALFTYLHLAADRAQAMDLIASGATCIAYETVTASGGALPLLVPMSEVAGRMAVQVGAHYLEKPHGGRGILLGGVPGVAPAKVVVLGDGTVGSQAIEVALGLGAEVWVLGHEVGRLRALARRFGHALRTGLSTRSAVEQHVLGADLVIGAVLVPGAAAPKLVSAQLVKRMKPGAVVVDVAIDQGGCFETSRPTSHDQPTYVVDGVLHYCVANMPGAVPRTSAFALNNATLPFVLALARHGVRGALERDAHLLAGLNVHRGQVTHPAVAASLGLEYVDPRTALARS